MHAFLTLALVGGERSASRPGRFIARERAPGTHWIGGCVGPRAGLVARVQQEAGNFLNNWVTISFSRRILLHGVPQTVLRSK